MAVARYTAWRPRAQAQALVQALDEACRRAAAGNLVLTIGQAYYQLVRSGALPNTAAARKQLGVVAARARMSGLLDWDLLADGGRAHHPPAGTGGPVLPRVARDRGLGGGRAEVPMLRPVSTIGAGVPAVEPAEDRPVREVWIEKDGLAEVAAQAAAAAGVSWTSCDGLPSLAHLHRAALRFAAAIQTGRPVVMLYLGDLDPHGAVVERDLRTQLTAMVASHHLSRHQDLAGTRTRGAVLSRVLDHMRTQLGGATPLTFHRVALTRGQATQLQLPGDGAGGWEIEAADPLWLRGRLTHALEDHAMPGRPDSHDGPVAISSSSPGQGAAPEVDPGAEVFRATSSDQEGPVR